MSHINYESEFTQSEAELFVKNILQEIVQDGKVENLDKFYTKDAIGHYHEEVFDIQDMKARFLALKANTKITQINIGKIFLVDQFIMYHCQHDWIDKKDQNLHSIMVYSVYRMRNKKICEVWSVFDNQLATSYKEAGINFMGSVKNFNLNFKSKQDFLSKVALLEQVHLSNNNRLTDIERDCLYYYLGGFTSKETSIAMSISSRTVECHLSRIKDKFDCSTKFALRKKLFPGS